MGLLRKDGEKLLSLAATGTLYNYIEPTTLSLLRKWNHGKATSAPNNLKVTRGTYYMKIRSPGF